MTNEEAEAAVQMALAHIVDASAGLTREQAMIVGSALRAGWMTDEEREALRDLACAFDRLSTAGAPSEVA